MLSVALRKESVDRNGVFDLVGDVLQQVALRKESVDRNDVDVLLQVVVTASLSARRAWIEMLLSSNVQPTLAGRSPQGERG